MPPSFDKSWIPKRSKEEPETCGTRVFCIASLVAWNTLPDHVRDKKLDFQRFARGSRPKDLSISHFIQYATLQRYSLNMKEHHNTTYHNIFF